MVYFVLCNFCIVYILSIQFINYDCFYYCVIGVYPYIKSHLKKRNPPALIIKDLVNIESFYTKLRHKSGIYSFINTTNNMQYIGSSVNLHKRLKEHLSGSKSNKVLQRALKKYGLQNFNFIVYEFISNLENTKNIINIETSYIASFDFDSLYNFKANASSLQGYKHTEEAKAKMRRRFSDKTKHPMFGKKHSAETLKLISKPGSKNPMFGLKHTPETIEKIKKARSKYTVELLDSNNVFLKSFINNVELANFLNINKSTVGRYIKSKKLFKNQYYFRKFLT